MGLVPERGSVRKGIRAWGAFGFARAELRDQPLRRTRRRFTHHPDFNLIFENLDEQLRRRTLYHDAVHPGAVWAKRAVVFTTTTFAVPDATW
jgi:hypothetical protein